MGKKYINNEDLYNEIKKYKDTGVISNELGEMFELLAKHNSHLSYFRGYSKQDIEDMRVDAVIACLKAIDNFDLNKKNPFSFFTTIVQNAFRYYLKKMYEHRNLKMELIEEEYIKQNKTFNNEIKKDMIESEKEKKHEKFGIN